MHMRFAPSAHGMSPRIAVIPEMDVTALSVKQQTPTGSQLWHQGLCVRTRAPKAAQVSGFDLQEEWEHAGDIVQILSPRLWAEGGREASPTLSVSRPTWLPIGFRLSVVKVTDALKIESTHIKRCCFVLLLCGWGILVDYCDRGILSWHIFTNHQRAISDLESLLSQNHHQRGKKNPDAATSVFIICIINESETHLSCSLADLVTVICIVLHVLCRTERIM